MAWLYHRNYFGPDRRGGRFHVRLLERRKQDGGQENRVSLQGVLRDLFVRGLKWVDVASYFGPDRRSGAFSHFIMERRRRQSVGSPPPLHAALRQLRVRLLDAETSEGRRALQERLTATALLADAQGRTRIGDHLMRLAEALGRGEGDVAARLQSELLTAEAMLQDPSEHSGGP
jgi:hypothetical protein